jgi:hypothetical protein
MKNLKCLFFILVFCNVKIFCQEYKLLTTFSPNDCATFSRSVIKILGNDNDFNLTWVLEEAYKGHQQQLEKTLNINFGNNVIYSDSLFNYLTKKGPSVNIYLGDSLILNLPQVSLNESTFSLITSTLSKQDKNVKYKFPSEFLFSNNNVIKMRNENFTVLDNIYNQITSVHNSKISKISGKELFSKKIYYEVFKEHSYFDSIMFYFDAVKDIGYNTVQIKNFTIKDSTIVLLCGLPIITRLDIDKSKIAVLPSPALISLDCNLNIIGFTNLSSVNQIVHQGKNHHFTFTFFDYYNSKYYVNYTFHRDSIFDQRNKLFGTLEVTNSNTILFKFSNISLPKHFWSLSSHVTSYLFGSMPFIYSNLMPLEINFEEEYIVCHLFEAFSLSDLQKVFSGASSNRAIFVINSIYKDDNYLQLLYSKDGINFKEIYDLKSREKIYRYRFDDLVIKARKSNVLPVFWNRAIYLNNNNELIEVTF